MSFIEDIDTDIENFKNAILSLNIEVGSYKDKCEPYFRETFNDVSIVKQDMKDTIAKSVFISSLEGDHNE